MLACIEEFSKLHIVVRIAYPRFIDDTTIHSLSLINVGTAYSGDQEILQVGHFSIGQVCAEHCRSFMVYGSCILAY